MLAKDCGHGRKKQLLTIIRKWKMTFPPIHISLRPHWALMLYNIITLFSSQRRGVIISTANKELTVVTLT